MQTLVASVLTKLQRGELPAHESLARLGESQPEGAAHTLLRAASLPELAATRSSWVPALLLSARPGHGAERLYELTRRARERSGEALNLAGMPSLALLLGSSDFLGRTLIEHPGWALDLEGDPPPPPGKGLPARSWDAIAETKYRGLLRVAARQLLGCPLSESQEELSGLAEGCLTAALERACSELGVDAPGMVALEELGSREFSVAPDVALLFLDSDSSSSGDPERSSEVARLVQHLVEQLAQERDGRILYRADRVFNSILMSGNGVPSVGEAVRALAKRRESQCRHELLRARPIGGPEEVGQAFVSALAPLVYVQQCATPGLDGSGWVLPRTDRSDLDWSVKDSPGGIRDLEHLVHSLVLQYGRELPAVRTGNVADALSALGRFGALEERCAGALIECSGWLRRAEYFLQLTNEESTWDFPRDPEGQSGLARCMGYREPEASRARTRLLRDWSAVREEVQLRCAEFNSTASDKRWRGRVPQFRAAVGRSRR